MNNKAVLSLVLLVSSFLMIFDGISAVRISNKAMMVGGWKPIEDVKDPHVVEIGEFAVNEYNKKEKKGLVLNEIVSGESQVVSGINYKLVLDAKDGSSNGKYEAIVWEKVWIGYRNLTSFKKV